MIQITEQMERIFVENPLSSKDGQGMNAKAIARFYIPGTSIQWLVTEASKEKDKRICPYFLTGHQRMFHWMKCAMLKSMEFSNKNDLIVSNRYLLI